MRQRESYYAALERQRVGEASLQGRFSRDDDQSEVDALEGLYTEVGMKAFAAFNNCLDWLGGLSRSAGSGRNDERGGDTLKDAVTSAMSDVQETLSSLSDRMSRIEGNIAALEAGMRRIDKFTLEAFRNIQEIEERIEEGVGAGRLSGQDAPLRGRLAKEEAADLALEAARRMRSEGKRLTLAAVAREAGLKYGQIVYAFGTKDGFIQALEKDLHEQKDSEASTDDGESSPSGHEAGERRTSGYEETASA